MRVFPVLLICLALATCSSNILRPEITTLASAELQGHRRVQLHPLPAPSPDESGAVPNIARLTPMLREGLSLRGYSEDASAELRAYYWLDLHVIPIDVEVDQAPPAPLGPYQSVHRLRDENATLHLRLSNAQSRVLWEGQIDSSLSPSWDSDQQLQKAWDALLQQLPMAH
ncbi:MAG: hypothetical protein Q8R10_05510 [Pseudomonas sp.]|uniref:hypothetical protein n=1 Tax=Pseudomonas sp. TaxID=306 RepID=UPI002734DC92|nr:hypothetical protein [Pseudomonas sp.]MDP3845867.1 hypothetical protein [Pseudomonas sp.]